MTLLLSDGVWVGSNPTALCFGSRLRIFSETGPRVNIFLHCNWRREHYRHGATRVWNRPQRGVRLCFIAEGVLLVRRGTSDVVVVSYAASDELPFNAPARARMRAVLRGAVGTSPSPLWSDIHIPTAFGGISALMLAVELGDNRTAHRVANAAGPRLSQGDNNNRFRNLSNVKQLNWLHHVAAEKSTSKHKLHIAALYVRHYPAAAACVQHWLHRGWLGKASCALGRAAVDEIMTASLSGIPSARTRQLYMAAGVPCLQSGIGLSATSRACARAVIASLLRELPMELVAYVVEILQSISFL